MNKNPILMKRRKYRVAEGMTSVAARDCRASTVSLLKGLGAEFETHWSEDEKDGYDGFTLSYDPPWDRTWYIVKNPFGGSNLEIALESGFDVAFGNACWRFRPTVRGHADFREMISALLNGRAASVSCLADGEDAADAILVGEMLSEGNERRLLDRIAEREYYRTEQDVYCSDSFNMSLGLKRKLRKLTSRKGWVASYEFWNPAMNREVDFRRPAS